RGAFKMAAFGRSSIALFNQADQSVALNICAKRSFYESVDQAGYIVTPSPGQAEDLMIELKSSVWSACLLEDVYDGVDQYALPKLEPPPLLPRMRFVGVAFATEGKQAKDLNGTKPSRSVFLVEELIDERIQGAFRKYINNRRPIPATFTDPADRTRASFLAFSQHWQFKRTHGLAFVSDYQ
ncbi:hypothetical protein B0H11DRAFT_1663001, partial [Mycena galericulata]